MFFQQDRTSEVLSVADDYARLVRVHGNGDAEFELHYAVDTREAVAREALTVAVDVFTRTIKRKRLLDDPAADIDTRRLVRNVITQAPDAKAAARQRDEYIVATRASDITARINNEIVGLLRTGAQATSIPQLSRPVLRIIPASELKESAEVRPVLTQVAHRFVDDIQSVHSSSISENVTALMHDMIVRQGIDPSHVVDMAHRSVPAADAIEGTLRPARALEFEHSPASRLLHSYLFPHETHYRPLTTTQVSDSTMVQVLGSEASTVVEVPVTITIPRHALQLEGSSHGHLYVRFQLLDSRTSTAIDTVFRPLDVARHVQLYYTPRRPPLVKVSRSEVSTRVNLEIKQVDPGANAVQVFKKVVHSVGVDTNDYVLVGSFNVRSTDQALLVQVDMSHGDIIIYRTVPVGELGTQGFDYANVVVRPARYQPIKSLTLTAFPVDVGVRLEARNIPQGAVAVEFKARNRTTFEGQYRNVGGGVSLVDPAVRAADFATVVDRDVQPGNVYEYVAHVMYAHGTSALVGHTLVEFLQPTPGRVDTRVSDLVVDQGDEPNVTFSIVTTLLDQGIDVVKRMLQRQDIYDLFKDDVLRERELLSNLIAHAVHRVDLTSGRREDFGVVTGQAFSDSELRKNLAIDPLKIGHRYRYEVTPLLRAPETLFDSLQKERTDAVTKKTYTFNPAKFLHPIALTRGVLVTSQGLRTRYSKEPMVHGAIGAAQTVEVSFDQEPARIVDSIASRFDRRTNVVSWKLEGAIDQVDHFIIMKDAGGVRTIVGKAHSEFQYGNCQYVHAIGRRDQGAFSYVIVPVFNNYAVGTAAVTNTITVEPQHVRRAR